ncbi:MAG: hypothetical protein KAG53_00235, partial [Endozoicomonadaceae bacterium]|nr:hypothetical protein [Endozoicomonadaceae bacterium]
VQPKQSKTRASRVQPNKSRTQVCGKCGDQMVKRVLKQSDHAGREAWVCSSYPRCRSAIMIASEIPS